MTRHAVIYTSTVSRWEPNARDRLERAALELFTEQGFADTSVPQITARAGLTTRTFFRHFADKREVLFAGEDDLPVLVATMMADAPGEFDPMTLIEQGLQTVAVTLFDGRRDALLARKAIIQSDESLRERELRKISALSEAIKAGFVSRGVDDLTATLTAEISMTVFSVSLQRWLGHDSDRSLTHILHDTLRALRAVASPPSKESSHALTRHPSVYGAAR